MATHEEIRAAFHVYADAYALLENLQNDAANASMIPATADQKTGMIGEYWAMCHAKAVWPAPNTVSFAPNPSQSGWDIMVTGENNAGLEWIQVKTVSEWSRTRAMTPIHKPNIRPNARDEQNWHAWTRLWLLLVSRKFQPLVFWEFLPDQVNFGNNNTLSHKTIRMPEKRDSGSHCFQWESVQNLIEEFRQNVGFPPLQ